MNRRRVLVLGTGVAGLTCARFLAARGWHVECVAHRAFPGPVIILDRSVAELLLEVWETDATLFAGAHRLRGRSVGWEHGAPSAYSAAPGLAMPVDVLAARLAVRAEKTGLRFVAPESADPADYDWVVRAGGREAMAEDAIQFGRRPGIAVPIKLTPRARTDCATMESVPGGWLFVIPHGLGRGSLQAVFAQPRPDTRSALHSALQRSLTTGGLVEDIVGEPHCFAAMPRLAVAPCTAAAIAVGDAAIALDPLSGSGIGSGVRSAILAAAVLDAGARDAVPDPYFCHYARRLRDSMRQHVLSCVAFYGRAVSAPDWRTEIDEMMEALFQLPAEVHGPQFRLDHGRLKAIPA